MVQLKVLPVFLCVMGLYYCSYMEKSEIIFRHSTSLQVKGCDSPAVFFMTLGFGAVSVILLTVLIFIILKHRKTHTGQ
ncbi:Ig kappa chain V19-17-like [Clarias magur]|uniref:Ig kappa chain V19-17-like n=1 Tax=Clarias magur TaxID=1594786 RepID=A0A8J4U3G7_CLAMG|nr:Ig kappa chain V19-17-like [Clarias magur]